MPDPNKVVEVLRAALAKMNESGKHWTKGTLHTYDDNGEDMYCSLGAIWEATGVNTARIVDLSDDGATDAAERLTEEGDVETRQAAVLALAMAVENPVSGTPNKETHKTSLYNIITWWNDRQAQEWAEVQEMFARAEKIALKNDQA